MKERFELITTASGNCEIVERNVFVGELVKMWFVDKTYAPTYPVVKGMVEEMGDCLGPLAPPWFSVKEVSLELYKQLTRYEGEHHNWFRTYADRDMSVFNRKTCEKEG